MNISDKLFCKKCRRVELDAPTWMDLMPGHCMWCMNISRNAEDPDKFDIYLSHEGNRTCVLLTLPYGTQTQTNTHAWVQVGSGGVPEVKKIMKLKHQLAKEISDAASRRARIIA